MLELILSTLFSARCVQFYTKIWVFIMLRNWHLKPIFVFIQNSGVYCCVYYILYLIKGYAIQVLNREQMVFVPKNAYRGIDTKSVNYRGLAMYKCAQSFELTRRVHGL